MAFSNLKIGILDDPKIERRRNFLTEQFFRGGDENVFGETSGPGTEIRQKQRRRRRRRNEGVQLLRRDRSQRRAGV